MLASKPDMFIFKGPSLLFSDRGPTLEQNTFEPISCSCRFLFLLTVIFSMSFSPSLHLTPDQSAQNVCPSSFLSIGSPSTAILQWNLHCKWEQLQYTAFINWNETGVAKNIVKEKPLLNFKLKYAILHESICFLMVATALSSSIVCAILPHLLSQYINLAGNQVLLLIPKLGPSFKWPHKLPSDMFELNSEHDHNFTKRLLSHRNTKILFHRNTRILSHRHTKILVHRNTRISSHRKN